LADAAVAAASTAAEAVAVAAVGIGSFAVSAVLLLQAMLRNLMQLRRWLIQGPDRPKGSGRYERWSSAVCGSAGSLTTARFPSPSCHLSQPPSLNIVASLLNNEKEIAGFTPSGFGSSTSTLPRQEGSAVD